MPIYYSVKTTKVKKKYNLVVGRVIWAVFYMD